MRRTLVIALLVLLVVTNVVLIYLVIDTSLNLTDKTSELAIQNENVNVLSSLVLDFPRNVDKQEVLRFLKQRYPEEIVKVHGDTIEFGNLAIQFRDGSVSKLKRL
jgi:hypothetical protein